MYPPREGVLARDHRDPARRKTTQIEVSRAVHRFHVDARLKCHVRDPVLLILRIFRSSIASQTARLTLSLMKVTISEKLLPPGKTPATPSAFSRAISRFGITPPTMTNLSPIPSRLIRLHQLLHDRQVRPAHDRKPYDIDVLLDRNPDNLIDGCRGGPCR